MSEISSSSLHSAFAVVAPSPSTAATRRRRSFACVPTGNALFAAVVFRGATVIRPRCRAPGRERTADAVEHAGTIADAISVGS